MTFLWTCIKIALGLAVTIWFFFAILFILALGSI